MTDPRLDAINLLSAIIEHDLNLSSFDIMDLEMAIKALDRSMEVERMKEACNDIQTQILDSVIPAGVRHG